MGDYFLKWHPEKALLNSDWTTLPIISIGIFHRLYDFAITTDAHGILLKRGLPVSDADLAEYLKLTLAEFGTALEPLLARGFMARNPNPPFTGTLYFPKWNGHQRQGPYRSRGRIAEEFWAGVGTEMEQNGTDLEPESKSKIKSKSKRTTKEEKDKALASLTFPAALNTEGFHKAWTEWVMCCAESKKPLTLRAAKMQLKHLAEVGSEAAIKSIEKSIASRWQGLFPEREKRDGRPNQKGTSGDKPSGRRYRASKKVEA